MQQLTTDVLVIGGGATGTGVLRDLAMRGLKCILIERRDLAYGTTGRYHGLLHSGGRYVVKDPGAAALCYKENQILRKIMPQCIEDTGGFFVSTSDDPPDYIAKFAEGCKKAGIPAEEIDIRSMLIAEPGLNPRIYHCFRVPDASADSFLAAQLNAESAREYGAKVLTYHEFGQLLTKTNESGGAEVTGALCRDVIRDEAVQIDASIVVNASGAWAGKVVQTAGIPLEMVPGKGTMIALNHRVVNTVINRCKLPSDGDILVPSHTVAVMGTTDIKVADPDHYAIEPWEIRLMLEEGEKIIPGFMQLRILRAWAGVRPLVKTSDATDDRDLSRDYVLIDHAQRDGVEGLITITSGKWTTYRKMAEATVDQVCARLKIDRPCRTHLEALPSSSNASQAFYQVGHRLDETERTASYGKLICECELVTTDELTKAIVQSDSVTLDDLRRETRLGMGPCQSAFCSIRAAGIMQSLRQNPIGEINNALREFLEERWKGDRPILSGKQLHQVRFNEFIYVDVLNAPDLPGEKDRKLSTESYSKSETIQFDESAPTEAEVFPPGSSKSPTQDAIIIGAGYAGLMTAWQLAERGKSVSVITRGWGTPYWASGCIDIFGYAPPEFRKRIDNPLEFIERYAQPQNNHPYQLTQISAIEASIKAFLELCSQSGHPYQGSLGKNVLIPTALGTLRPTCYIPSTMVAGTADLKTPMLIVGFDDFLDFYPGLIAENINAQGLVAHSLSLDLPSLRNRKFVSGMVLARLFDQAEFRQEVIDHIKPKLGNAGRVGFPAVLGINHPMQVLENLQSALGRPVFEIPGLPPSIPGIRLHNILVKAIEDHQGKIFNGMSVVASSTEGKEILSVWSEAASRMVEHRAKAYILATGGILGGGSTAQYLGYAQEAIFDLSMNRPHEDEQPLREHFLDSAGQPLHQLGVLVDSEFHPDDPEKGRQYSNLYVVGNSLAYCDPVRERSLEGVALATGYRVAEIIAGKAAG